MNEPCIQGSASWGQAPKPPGSASPSYGYGTTFCEAEQTLFASFFLEKEESHQSNSCFSDFFLGASPQTPWVGFAELWVWNNLLRSRTNAFCFFFWKKKKLINPTRVLVSFFLGESPQGRLRRVMGMEQPSAKQNKRFLLLFLEKEDIICPLSPTGCIKEGVSNHVINNILHELYY
jgi:hypothetical protein